MSQKSGEEMQSILNKIIENIEDKIVEILWFVVKAVIVAVIVALLLQIVPITIRHDGSVTVYQGIQGRRSVRTINSY